MIEHVANYLLFPMLAWSPPANHAYLHETASYVEARYLDIATDLATVVSEEEPLDIFDEPDDTARVHTALLMLAIASYESGGFRDDVDQGKKRGDTGKSYCLMQIMIRSNEIPPKDRKACFRMGLERIRESLALCPGTDSSIRLAGYTAGSCIKGIVSSQLRFSRMEKWWSVAPWFNEVNQ